MSYYQMPQQDWLQGVFRRIDRDGSGRIDANELQSALSNGTWKPFNLETVKLLITLFGKTSPGTIVYPEFSQLWEYVTNWLNCFRNVDRDQSGNINVQELQTTLTSMGYRLSPNFYQIALRKFDRNNQNSLNFDDFIQLCCTIQMVTTAFQAHDTDRDGWIQINYEQFLLLVFSIYPSN